MNLAYISIVFTFCISALVRGDITGQNPPAGTCLCMSASGVNIRNSGCGTIVGSANTGQCFKGTGQKTTCSLSGVSYEFFAFEYAGSTGWAAGDYINTGSSSSCNPVGGDGNCGSVQIVTRSQWGARAPSSSIPIMSTPVSMAFIHHTVTASCTDQASCSAQMRQIQSYHMDGNGWPDIGYNFLVGEDGRAYEGRGWNKVGAHTYGYNSVAVAVSVIGDFTSRLPNQAALNAVKNVINCAVQQNYLVLNHEEFGHRDAGCTACPGDTLYPHIQTWPRYSFRDIPRYCKKTGLMETLLRV